MSKPKHGGPAPKLYGIRHENGQSEVVGFFIIQKNGDALRNKRAGPNASMEELFLRWNSYEDASAHLAKMLKRDPQPFIVQRSQFQQPTVWMGTADKSRDIYTNLYIGSYRYRSGALVDPMIVGTAAEVTGSETAH